MSDGAWGFAGVALTAVVALLVQQGRTLRQTKQINRAVNHQPSDAPTLVERVGSIEARTEVIEEQHVLHRQWEQEAFSAIAHQIGTTLPPYPEGD